MAPKSKIASTAPKSEPVKTEGAGNLVQLLGLDTGASEAAIFSAVEALSKKVEAGLAELTERGDALKAAETAIAEREKAVTLQEQALQRDSDKAKQELQKRADALDELERGLDIRATDLRAARDKIAAWENEGGKPDETANTAAEGAPPVEGRVRVKVIGPKGGRWRAGRHFTPDSPPVDVTAEDLLAIKADPRLTVEETTE